MATPRKSPRRTIPLSSQVTEARRYHLDLTPNRREALTVVCGGCERTSEGYEVRRETFPYYGIEFVAEGAGVLQLRGKEYPLRAGVVFFYGPGVPHVIRADERNPMRKYYVDFTGSEGRGLLSASQIREEPRQIGAPQEVIDLFEALQTDALTEGPLQHRLCAAHLRVLLLKIGQKALPLSEGQPRALASYQKARRYMEENFSSIQTAEEAARGCYMTPVHLSRVFRRFAKISPYQFLTRLKMNRAAEMLLDSGLLVKEVAEQTGFPSAFQFSRAFKRVYGLAPEHFLRNSSRRPTV